MYVCVYAVCYVCMCEMVTTIITLNDGEYHEASLSSFLPLANISPIRTLDGMVCIGSEIAFQTEHPLLWGAGVIM